jgi:hypothetical protein
LNLHERVRNFALKAQYEVNHMLRALAAYAYNKVLFIMVSIVAVFAVILAVWGLGLLSLKAAIDNWLRIIFSFKVSSSN